MNMRIGLYQLMVFVLMAFSLSTYASVEFKKTLISGTDTEAEVCLQLDGNGDVYPVYVEMMAVAKTEFRQWADDNAETPISDYDGQERQNFTMTFLNAETEQCVTLARSEITDSDNILVYINNVVRSEHKTDLRAEILAPHSTFLNGFSLTFMQNGVLTRELLKNGGDVVITAVHAEEDVNDYIYTWAIADASLTDTDGSLVNNSFTFDPSMLNEGIYNIQLAISSNDLTRTVVLLDSVKVVEEELDAQLDTDLDGVTDQVEGGADIDTLSSDGRVFAQSHPDVTVVLGDLEFSLDQTVPQASLNQFEAWSGNDELNNNLSINAALTLRLINLEVPGSQVKVAVKLSVPTITNGAFFTYKNDRASTYSEKGGDNYRTIRSSQNNDCPELNESLYAENVSSGHNCLLLVITDGGENDADQIVNGQISIIGLFGRSGDVFATNQNDEDDDNGRVSPRRMEPGNGGVGLFYIFAMLVMLLSKRYIGLNRNV